MQSPFISNNNDSNTINNPWKGSVQKVTEATVRRLGEAFNINVEDKPASQVIAEIKAVVNNPETKKAISDASESAAVAFEAARPGLEKIIDSFAEMASKAGRRAIMVGKELLGEVPVVGPALELPMVLSDFVKMANTVVTNGSEILETMIQTIRIAKQAAASLPLTSSSLPLTSSSLPLTSSSLPLTSSSLPLTSTQSSSSLTSYLPHPIQPAIQQQLQQQGGGAARRQTMRSLENTRRSISQFLKKDELVFVHRKQNTNKSKRKQSKLSHRGKKKRHHKYTRYAKK